MFGSTFGFTHFAECFSKQCCNDLGVVGAESGAGNREF